MSTTTDRVETTQAPGAPSTPIVRVTVPERSLASELRLIIRIFILQLLLAFTITAFGVMVAVRIKQMQSFMGVMQMIVMPMFFISGALFPVANLPAWLTVLNRIDPLTYAVDPMRRLVFAHLDMSAPARRALDPGVTWWGWHVPAALEAGVVVALGV